MRFFPRRRAVDSPRERQRFPRLARLHRVERVVREDEERAAVRSAEHDLDRTLGHIDPADGPARLVVDEDLSVRDVDVARAIRGDALAAALGERLKIA